MKRKNIIITILISTIIFTIKYFTDAIKEEENLAENSVYYAKNMLHAKDKHPVLIMLIDNLEYLNKPKVDNIRYDIDGLNYIIKYKDEKTSLKLLGNIYSNGTKYRYINEKKLSYRFSENFKLVRIFDENYNDVDISTVDEDTLINETYEFVKPIVDSQTEPEVNLQEEFNKRYKERFN